MPHVLQSHSPAATTASQGRTLGWPTIVAVAAVVAPVAIGAAIGHPIAGVVATVVVLAAVSLVAVALDALDNTRPY